MPYAPSPRWDLETIFAGGLHGAPFRTEFAAVKDAIEALIPRTEGVSTGDLPAVRALLREIADVGERLGELRTYASCSFAADTTNADAREADVLTSELVNRLMRADVPIQSLLADIDDAAFEALLADTSMDEMAPLLRHRREGAKRLTLRPKALQALATDLEREALHGWGQLYDHLSGTLEVDLQLPGEAPKKVGIAVVNGMRGHADEAVRKAAYEGAAKAWGGSADVCAMALTHITGSRQTKFDRLGVDELAPTLHDNRVDRGILDAMWAAADHARPALTQYLARKAKLLGKPKLDAWDLLAPMPEADKTISWEQAQDVVVDAFDGIDPDMGAFAREALRKRWIDAESRPGRMPGGFCAPVPRSKQSRIFLTFTNTVDTMLTLAHELGHSFHDEILFQNPVARREVTSALAETASTFAEAVVRDAAIANAANPAARIQLIDQDLQAGVAFLMNIPARFQFEQRLFALRREGPFRADQLRTEMVDCLRRTHADTLQSYDDLFWASKLHFYISAFGFYNWSYTFGYLFSASVYQRAREEGPSFRKTYTKLLSRTGWDDTRAIGRDVLGEDLGDAAFWIRATKPLLRGADEFMSATV
jgi:oligoendopeptidase F